MSEAHRRELTAALSSILRDAYDSMVRDATNHNVKVDDLARILERLDLSSHHKKFKEEGIDLAAARKLTNDQFEELGITDYSQRSSLMAALEAAGNAGVRRLVPHGAAVPRSFCLSAANRCDREWPAQRVAAIRNHPGV